MRDQLLFLALPALLAAQTPEQLFEQRRFDEAKAAFQARLASNENDTMALAYMGRIAQRQGKSGEAVNWLERAVKLADNNARYHFWLGSALGDEAQKASKFRQPFLARRVRNEFERAVHIDPALIDARFGLLDFYLQAPGVMGGSMDKAQEQALEIGKLNVMQGHLAAARLARHQKDVAAEELQLKGARQAAPDSAQPYYSLAAFYRRNNRLDEALATYDALMKAKPAEGYAHANYGIVALLANRDLGRAEQELKLFLSSPPKDVTSATLSTVRFRLGQLYEKTERKDLAKAEYEEAVKQNPQNQDAKRALAALR